MTDDTSLQPAVAAEFAALAGLLERATEAQWDTPSLCEGWRVREVVAHMTMAARYPEDKFMAELRRCDFDFGRLSNEITRGHVHVRFGTNIDGRRLQATDLDWSYGSGPMLRGPAEDLALMLCARALPPERIEGEPLNQGQLVISSSDIE